MTEPLTLTVVEAAAALGVTPDWLSRAANRGDVPSRKIGHARRFTRTDLDEYLESVRQGGSNAAGTALSRRRRRSA